VFHYSRDLLFPLSKKITVMLESPAPLHMLECFTSKKTSGVLYLKKTAPLIFSIAWAAPQRPSLAQRRHTVPFLRCSVRPHRAPIHLAPSAGRRGLCHRNSPLGRLWPPATLFFKCFMRFETCCKLMYQVFPLFYIYVLSVLYGCCKSRSGCCIC
jgi:hypothetical protein